MKAVITGITGFRNRGVEAMVSVTVEQLSKRQPNLTINVVTDTPDYDRMRLKQDNVNPIKLLGRHQRLIKRLSAKAFRFYKPFLPDYHLFHEAAVVIASGGDIFSSDYGVGFLKIQLKPLNLALDAGIPVVFLAQSIGPFRTNEETQVWLRVAERSKLVTVREQLSYKYVTKELGLSPNIVKHTADPAFLLVPPVNGVTKLLKYYGIVKDQPVVAISASQGISKYTDGDYKKQLKAWYQVIEMLLDEFNAQVLLIPHVQDIKQENDDRIFATNLLKNLNFDPRVRLVGGDHSASEFKGLIGACDLVIAERMHACIAGLSSGVCTVPIGYSVKAEGIMTDLLGSTGKGLVISFQQFLETDTSCTMIRTTWNRRHEIAKQLNQVLPQVKKDAENNFELISQILA